jgi:hypothetical protein
MTALRHPIFPTPLFHTHTHTHLIHRSARSSILHDQRSSSCTISEAHLGAWLMKHDNRRRCPAGAWLTKHDHRRRCPAGAWPTKHNHAALRPNPQAIGGAWLTKQVLPGPSCTNTLGSCSIAAFLAHLMMQRAADEEGLAGPILHEHPWLLLNRSLPCALDDAESGKLCVFCVGTQDSGHVGSSKLDLLPSLTNCKKAA